MSAGWESVDRQSELGRRCLNTRDVPEKNVGGEIPDQNTLALQYVSEIDHPQIEDFEFGDNAAVTHDCRQPPNCFG